MNAVPRLLNANRCRRVKVAVVGDILRDQWVTGKVDRVCPEGPVPVLSVEEIVETPGGAASVASQFRHWNADVTLLGLVDAKTAELLDAHGIDRQHCFPLTAGANPVKRRLYAGGQMILRHDVEAPDLGQPNIEQARAWLMLRLTEVLASGIDIVVFSDYRKGCFDSISLRAMLEQCRRVDVPSVVDPKGPAVDYTGCTVLKPNAGWLRQHGGPFPFPGDLYFFKHKDICKALVCTRGEESPRGFDAGGDFMLAPPWRTAPVRSVAGAGDCFAAHLALAMAHGLPVIDAAGVAHSAGRAYVGFERGTPLLPSEALADLDPAAAKAVTPAELKRALEARHTGRRIILANGCFDLLHAGHSWTLQWARRQGHALVVALNSDESVRRQKGAGRPVVGECERAAQLAALECVDYVVTFTEDTPAGLLDWLPPVWLVKGCEWAGREADLPCAGHPHVKGVLVAPESPFALHTTDVLNNIRANNRSCDKTCWDGNALLE